MIIATYVFSTLGIIAYIGALITMKSPFGEILSDAGNACMLTAILVMLFQLRNTLTHG